MLIRLALIVALSLIFAPWGHAQEHHQHHAAHAHAPVEVAALEYAFEAPDEIPSGWTTFEFLNEGEEPHFLLIARLPEGRTYDEYVTDVLMPFSDVWYAIRDEGIRHEEAFGRLGANLPEWYWAVQFRGGAGIIPAGGSTEVTVYLEPGTYAIECYMKTEEGELHNVEGMIRELTVTETPSGGVPPEADVRITLSNHEMTVEGDLTAGRRTVEVHVEEDPEETFGHNVHVARDLQAEVDGVLRWMDFIEVEGLMAPTPGTFKGGMHLLPAGHTGYFTVDFEPGRYLFLSEYTAPMGVLREVTIDPS